MKLAPYGHQIDLEGALDVGRQFLLVSLSSVLVLKDTL